MNDIQIFVSPYNFLQFDIPLDMFAKFFIKKTHINLGF